MRRGVPMLAVLALCAVVLAGCGSSKKSSAGSATTTTEATTTQAAATTQAAPTVSTTTTQLSTGTTPSTTPSFAVSGKCKDLAQKAQAAMRSAAASGDVGATADALKSFASQVPSEIKGDVETIANALSKYADALKSAGYTPGKTPSAAQIPKIAAAAKVLQGQQAKLQAAEAHLTAWAKANCKA